jgi:hypothetical protein
MELVLIVRNALPTGFTDKTVGHKECCSDHAGTKPTLVVLHHGGPVLDGTESMEPSQVVGFVWI